MTVLFAERALLPTGWSRNQRVTVGAEGYIQRVEGAAAPEPGDEVLGDRILLPAPANLHSHAFQRAMAGLPEARRSSGHDSFWTRRTLMYPFLDALTPEDVQSIATMVQVEMAEAGYAALGEFHYLHNPPGGATYDDPGEMALRIVAAAHETGLGLTLLPVLYVQGGCNGRALEVGQLRFACDPDAYLRIAESARRDLAHDGRIGIAPHSLRAVPPETLGEAARICPDGPIHIHAAEQTAEIAEVEATYGARPVALLLERTGLGPRWCVIHATHMTPDETAGLARSGAVAGLCPITESNLGDGVFDGAGFFAAGGAFGVGSDSNIRISLSEELRTLEYSQRLGLRARAVLADARSTGRALFESATLGSAKACRRDAGAIAPGKLADLMTLDAAHISLAGLDGDMALDGWIFAGDDGAVCDCWSAGRRLVSAGRHFARDAVEARFRTTLAQLRDGA